MSHRDWQRRGDDENSDRNWCRTGARAGSFAETARFGDVVLLSVLGSAAEEVIRLAGAETLSGKIVIDVSG